MGVCGFEREIVLSVSFLWGGGYLFFLFFSEKEMNESKYKKKMMKNPRVSGSQMRFRPER